MKISKTFSLEEDVLEAIDKYRQDKKLSSLSSALERIILIELPKRTDLDEIKSLLSNIEIVKKDNIDYEVNEEVDSVEKEETCITTIENSEIDASIQESLTSMLDD